MVPGWFNHAWSNAVEPILGGWLRVFFWDGRTHAMVEPPILREDLVEMVESHQVTLE